MYIIIHNLYIALLDEQNYTYYSLRNDILYMKSVIYNLGDNIIKDNLDTLNKILNIINGISTLQIECIYINLGKTFEKEIIEEIYKIKSILSNHIKIIMYCIIKLYYR